MDYGCGNLKRGSNAQGMSGFTLEIEVMEMHFLADVKSLLRGFLGACETEVGEEVVAPGGE